jgi:hypothetical protein
MDGWGVGPGHRYIIFDRLPDRKLTQITSYGHITVEFKLSHQAELLKYLYSVFCVIYVLSFYVLYMSFAPAAYTCCNGGGGAVK